MQYREHEWRESSMLTKNRDIYLCLWQVMIISAEQQPESYSNAAGGRKVGEIKKDLRYVKFTHSLFFYTNH